jgi:hypothetical protein
MQTWIIFRTLIVITSLLLDPNLPAPHEAKLSAESVLDSITQIGLWDGYRAKLNTAYDLLYELSHRLRGTSSVPPVCFLA